MITSLTCSEVRRESLNGTQFLVVIASRDERRSERMAPADAPSLVKIRNALTAQGLILGWPLPVSKEQMNDIPDSSDAPVHFSSLDEHGEKHHLIAERAEEYSLSSGSNLCRLFVRASGDNLDWLVGRTIELGVARHASESAAAMK